MAEIRDYIIGIIIFTFFIVGGVSVIGMFKDKDASFGTEDKFQQFNSSFSKLDTVTTSVNGIETSITSSDNTQFGVFGVLNALISTSWNTLKLTFSSFSFMNDIFRATSTVFGVPSWIPAMIILIIVVVIAFAIFSAIFQKEV